MTLSASLGLVDFPVQLVDFIHHLLNRQVIFMDLFTGEVRPLRESSIYISKTIEKLRTL